MKCGTIFTRKDSKAVQHGSAVCIKWIFQMISQMITNDNYVEGMRIESIENK